MEENCRRLRGVFYRIGKRPSDLPPTDGAGEPPISKGEEGIGEPAEVSGIKAPKMTEAPKTKFLP